MNTTDTSAAKLVEALRSSLRENDRLKQQNRQLSAAAREPIAIVGMACRFPGGVASPEELWELVSEGRDAMSGFPVNRDWDLERLYDPDPEASGSCYVKESGFLHDADAFDPALFGISPREALAMDPQQRLLLETVWETYERGGIDPASARGSRTGVFVGGMRQDYGPSTYEPAPEVEGHKLTGVAASVMSGRLSYVFGLEGPSVTVDTACSSALVALHLAVRSLRSGESDMALAGGVMVMTTPDTFIEFSHQRGLAADGRVKAFAAAADGTSMSEGVGVLLVERLSDARRKGHRVLAVVRGTAVNQDGASNGLTAPNGPAQQRVIRDALADAGLGAAEVDAVEAHGTGTRLGDPIEAEALLATYGQGREEGRPLWLGSVKSNIGHTQAAAGMAGIIKMVQAIRHGQLPRTLHVDRPNPEIDWESGAVSLLTEHRDWPGGDRPRRAAVSSFGVSGTNAHAVIEQAPEPAAATEAAGARTAPATEQAAPAGEAKSAPPAGSAPTDRQLPLVPLPLSARTPAALRARAEQLGAFLAERPGLDLPGLGLALATTRAALDHRALLLVPDRAEALSELAALAEDETGRSAVAASAPGRTAFLFSGQGSQYAGMGRELHAAYPEFARALDEVTGALDAQLARRLGPGSALPGIPAVALRKVMFAEPDTEHAALLQQTAYTQPALFALEVALHRLLAHWGITPDLLIGHSLGEITAAHLAGVLDLGDAATLVTTRATLMQAQPTGGAMTALQATEDETAASLPADGTVAVAAVNGPAETVISGDHDAVHALAAQWASQGRKTTHLRVSHAFHSPHMDGMLDAFRATLRTLTFHAPTTPLISNISGELATTAELSDPDYWTHHVRTTVRFHHGLRTLHTHDTTTYLELGPGHALTQMATGTLGEEPSARAALALPLLRREQSEVRTLTTAVAKLFTHGRATPRWQALFGGAEAFGGALPTYPFQRERFWRLPAATGGDLNRAGLGAAQHPLLGAVLELADSEGLLLTGRLSLDTHPWLADHVVAGAAILPGTAFVELALHAAQRTGLSTVAELTHETPLVLPESGAVHLQLSLGHPDEQGRRTLAIHSRPEDTSADTGWTRHTTGLLGPGLPPKIPAAPATWPPEGAVPLPIETLYEEFEAAGITYGPVFRGVQAAWRHGEEIYTTVVLPQDTTTEAENAPYTLHPALLDAALHGITLGTFTTPAENRATPTPHLPFAWTDIHLHRATAETTTLHTRLTPTGQPNTLTLSTTYPDGTPLASARSLTLRPLTTTATTLSPPLHTLTWAPLAYGVDADYRPESGSWAVLGETEWTGSGAEVHRDPAELVGALAEERAAAPEVVFWRPQLGAGTAQEVTATEVHDAAEQVLTQLQVWLAEDSLRGARLAVVTEAAAPELLREPVHALVRAAESENPGRFLLLDMDEDAASREALPRAVASVLAAEEPQLALYAGELSVPRIGRLAPEAPEEAAEAPEAAWDPEGTVLLTGGGSLAAELAGHLVGKHGVRRLCLASRRGAAAPGAEELRAELTALGAQVTFAACDLTDRAAVTDLVGSLSGEHPLTAVVHTAGILDDGLTASLTPDRLHRVLAPKVDAALHLHQATRHLPLDRFVLFSSLAAALGSPGQANYAAGNAFLDALARHRRENGLAGQSLAWGPWSQQGGMTAHLADADLSRMAGTGVSALSVAEGLDLFDAADARPAEAAVVAVRWEFRALRRQGEAGRLPAALRALVPVAPRRPAPAAGGGAGSPELRERLAALGPAERTKALHQLLAQEVGAALGHSRTPELEPTRGFKDLGFDSLTAVQLRNRLGEVTGLRLPATLVFDYPDPAALTAYLGTELAGELAGAATRRPAATAVRTAEEPVVLVGMACRYPGGVSSPEDLWDLVAGGQDAISAFPTDRGWDLEGLYHPDPEHLGTSYARHGGFLHEAAGFDAALFGISPREALAMDPQQRLLLETAWEAFERTGIDPLSLRGSRTGVFAGLMYHEYASRLPELPADLEGYFGTGNTGSVASGRLSYVFGLEGPAVTVDTACSSSLVALHLAAQSLRNGECDLALAGGVAVMASPGTFVEFSRQRGLAQDGRCKSFAAAADGTGWGEGVGLLLVERLSDAQRNGHPVLAVVRSTAVNQDGASNGLTAPNGPSQQRVITTALQTAGLTGSDVDAVEAHGTGTALGDPIEAQALLATYGQDRPEDRPLWLGSIKSNIGHTQSAAGVAGIIKMVQAIRHGQLPATLHVDEPTPHVDWSSGGVQLLTEQREWPALDRPRRAAVSSFGISGTNAHVILEQAPDARQLTEAPGQQDPGPEVRATDVTWLLSGHTDEALRAHARRLHSHLTIHTEPDPASVASTLLRRPRLAHRAAVLGTTREELLTALTALAKGEPHSNVITGTAHGGKTVFVFPGQGSQWVGMGTGLLKTSPVFAKSMEECAQALAPFTDWSLLEVLDDADALARVDVVQPATWAVMVSLARWWQDHGIHPDAVIGHSQGEIAAAHIAGALSLEDAARVVALRSKALTTLAGTGGMMSLALSAEQAGELIASYGDDLHLAALNSPTSTVVAGTTTALDALQQHCEAEGIRHRRIPVDYASHTPLVEPLRAQLASQIGELTPRQSDIPFYSTVTTEPVDTTTLTTDYWFTNLRTTVHFNPTIQKLLNDGHTHYIETSPHPGLTTAVQETTEAPENADTETDPSPLTTHATLLRNDDTPTRLHHALAHAHTHGLTPASQPTSQPTTHHPDLPTYPFQHKRYWLTAPASPATESGGAGSEDTFWNTVESTDPEELSTALSLPADSVAPVVSALRAWRERSRTASALNGLRYRVSWTAQYESPAPEPLTGSWLLSSAVPPAAELTGALVAAGATGVHHLPDPAGLAEALDTYPEVAGVLSLGATPAGALAVTQALAATGRDLPLWHLTSGAVRADPGDPAPDPAQAAVWGLGRVAALEHPGQWGGLVDLPAAAVPGRYARLAGVLATGPDPQHEDQLALRGTTTYARRLTRAPQQAVPGAAAWRPRGTTIVTGGTSGMGVLLARWLARSGAAHLLLTGPVEEGAAAELVAELTEAGAGRVTLADCVLTERESVRGLLDSVPSEQPLTAVFHTAGTDSWSALADLSPAELAEGLGVRCTGAALLHELTATGAEPGAEAPELVLFSSVAGVWGSAGQGAHAAGVAWLDALAEARRAAGLSATSVAWGPWEEAPLAAPDAPAQEERRAQLKRRGLAELPTGAVLDALRGALAQRETAVVVAEVDWARFTPVFTASRPGPLLSALPEAVEALAESGGESAGAGRSALADRLSGLPPEEREAELLLLVRQVAAAVLGHQGAQEVPAQRPFKELGFDSLASVSLRNQLAEATGTRLPATLVFDHPTPLAVTRLILTLLGGAGADGPAEAEPAGALTDARDPAYATGTAEVAEAVAAFSDEELFDFIEDRLGSFGQRGGADPGRDDQHSTA
ncbi:polyketide synthase type I [Streptomyces albus]|uniref:Polyketide synthase type I n=1 Tax=Streptomyces albus (strain ATCC 21838 / DSM 41398 / FERM P-419 / JCM 4703 / NBRC 107858) TaxID=1081613 RepID=A0A0B5EH14_STRA4|nr:polyketide synthase type I [Streptomyces albus]AOU75754.1 polyketide synthase type I [Streptomyces albus]AYN31558.1 type I polyketide synthase [Streptomyces albus]